MSDFPGQLMSLLNDEDVQRCIHWLPSGRAFTISKPELFVNTVLKMHFNSVQFESFVVRLKKWGFERLGKKVNNRYLSYTFASPMFRRDQPHLCNSMRLIKSNPRRSKKGLVHLFDAMKQPTAMPTGYMNVSPPPTVNQVKMPSWENSSPQSVTPPWGHHVPFPAKHYMPQPSCQYLPLENRYDWMSPRPMHHQENVQEPNSDHSRKAWAAAALMHLAHFAK